MKRLSITLLTLLALGGCAKEIPVPEGSVLYCDDDLPHDFEISCDVYNLGLICSGKETNWRQNKEIFEESWLLLNTEDQKIRVFSTRFDLGEGGKIEKKSTGSTLYDFTTNPEYYRWEHKIVKKISYNLYRENLELVENRVGHASSMMCKLSSPEQVKLEIDSLEEFFLKKRKLKQEEQRLKDAEQLQKNKI
jgi:hypothetical protein